MPERKLSSTNSYNQAFLEEKCALNELINLLSKRWMTEVLFAIEDGSTRFTGLKENLEHISDHILADRLKLLEKYDLIRKSQFPGTPSRTDYTLTAKGTTLSDILDGLCQFAENEMKF